ncbi:MAG: FtsX-like permease family protein [Thermoplasmata archaeon]|nr:FtsX-like permease family protein [Thermoplasmata archaeon]
MGLIRNLIDRGLGIFTIVTLFYLLGVVVIALYFLPFIETSLKVLELDEAAAILKTIMTFFAFFLMMLTLLFIGIRALMNRLQFRMGFRNLIRHKGDTVIAILGFMIGTSIICSSMAIGDTMNNMIEDLIYDGYDLYDEYIYLQDGNGDRIYINGSLANNMSDLAWDLNDEGETLVDGVSWEVMETGSVIDHHTALFEPMMSLRAFSKASTGAFGGLYIDGNEVNYDLAMDEVYMTADGADLLEAKVGDNLDISSGLLMKNYTVKGIVDQTGRASTFFDGNALYFSFGSIWSLFNVTPDQEVDYGIGEDWSGGYYNVMMISNEGGRVGGADHCSEVILELEEDYRELEHPLGPNGRFEFVDDKATSVEQGMEGIKMFSQLFMVLGTFTIIAGITLIINIFVMLSEERKEEMGISRAVGMKRKHLSLIYLFEGTLYSIISSFVGVLLGVATGYGIIFLLQWIFDAMGMGMLDILGSYRVTSLSLILSFVAGFSITIGTTIFITRRISRLNIVSAIRNTPVPMEESKLVVWVQELLKVRDMENRKGDGSLLAKSVEYIFNRMTFLGTWAIIFGLLLFFWGMGMETQWNTYMGLSLLLIGASLMLKYFLNERLTYSIAASLMLVLWIVPIPAFIQYSSDMEMFILSGIFLVTSGVLLLVWNTDIILWAVERMVTFIGISPASIKMSISYPIKKRFRTGVTIFMFALIIFTITTMSMIVALFNVNIDEFEKSIGGGYDIIAFSAVGIDDLESTIMLEDPNSYSSINWDYSVSISMGILKMNFTNPFHGGSEGSNLEQMYQCAGVSDKFIQRNTYGFIGVAWDIIDKDGNAERTDRYVWELLNGTDYVILDGSQSSDSGMGPPGLSLMELGDVITLQSIDGRYYNKTVIGFTEQFGLSAVFMDEETAAEEFGVTQKTIHLIRTRDVDDMDDFANGLRRSMLKYLFYTVIIKELVGDMLKAQNAFFDLFNAFLSLGLVIGIVGLGIVTLRSVYERRHEIGMMRAIGFKRKQVVLSFLGESTFIAGSGLLTGTILGIVVGWIIWRDGMQDLLPEFGVPWLKLTLIVLTALFFALVSSIPPSLKASRVSPAEALRYE